MSGESAAASPVDIAGWDVVTLGETMLRLTPRGFERFEQSSSVEVHVGGSESNTAVGLARLGHRVCWLSRLTCNPLGKLISNTIAAQGVDVSQVIWTDQDRVGTYYLERGSTPRNSEVFYDRADSAMSRMSAEDLPPELFSRLRPKFFHTTGITLGISASATATAEAAAQSARDAGCRVSFDVNFRSRLWTPQDAAEACDRYIEFADLVFLPRRDAVNLYGASDSDTQQICRQLQRRWAGRTIVLTLGADGAAAIDSNGDYYYQPVYSAFEVERLGGGDAFSAGFLSAQSTGLSVRESLRWGAAAAAIKYTIPGDLPLFDRSSVQSLASSGVSMTATINR